MKNFLALICLFNFFSPSIWAAKWSIVNENVDNQYSCPGRIGFNSEYTSISFSDLRVRLVSICDTDPSSHSINFLEHNNRQNVTKVSLPKKKYQSDEVILDTIENGALCLPIGVTPENEPILYSTLLIAFTADLLCKDRHGNQGIIPYMFQPFLIVNDKFKDKKSIRMEIKKITITPDPSKDFFHIEYNLAVDNLNISYVNNIPRESL